MKINAEIIKKSVLEVFEELNLQNYDCDVIPDLVSLLDDNNIHNIKHIQSSDDSNMSWTVKIYEVTDSGKKVLGGFSVPSRNERAISDVKEYVKENIKNLINLK